MCVSIGRHSDSLDVNRFRCGICHSTLVRLGRFNADGTPAKEKVASGFALYVKEKYSAIKGDNQMTPHKEIMKLIATQYKIDKSKQQAPAASSAGPTLSVSEEQKELERQMSAFDQLSL